MAVPMSNLELAPIVCGTDFSGLAREAATLAHSIARKQGVGLHLLHVGEGGEQTLRAAASELGPDVIAESCEGHPDEVLVERAAALRASLLVVGSLGRRQVSDWLLGSTAERVVRLSRVPSLVVRAPERLREWLAGSRRLRVVIAVGDAATSAQLFTWLDGMAQLGPVDRLAVHVGGGPHLNDEWFESELSRLQQTTGLPRSECRLEVGQWSVEEHLLAVASSEKADLIVVGRHLRSGLERLWRGSVSMAVLKRAELSVACIPVPTPG